jgi:hypothetical protein
MTRRQFLARLFALFATPSKAAAIDPAGPGESITLPPSFQPLWPGPGWQPAAIGAAPALPTEAVALGFSQTYFFDDFDDKTTIDPSWLPSMSRAPNSGINWITSKDEIGHWSVSNSILTCGPMDNSGNGHTVEWCSGWDHNYKNDLSPQIVGTYWPTGQSFWAEFSMAFPPTPRSSNHYPALWSNDARGIAQNYYNARNDVCLPARVNDLEFFEAQTIAERNPDIRYLFNAYVWEFSRSTLASKCNLIPVTDFEFGAYVAPLSLADIQALLPGFDHTEFNRYATALVVPADNNGIGFIRRYMGRAGGPLVRLPTQDWSWNARDPLWDHYSYGNHFCLLGCGSGFPMYVDWVRWAALRTLPIPPIQPSPKMII